MSKTPASAPPQLISAYPSCERCVSWSEAGLVVAGGENVYFASDRDAQSHHGSSNGRIQVLRVDTFDHDEWPDAPMATIADLSIGEEQSESVVVAIAWSPPGLGIHRRCVLAVLTSNLVLALWETDGSRNSWRRTCIVNNYVQTHALDVANKPTAKSRKSGRVRAFVWLPPLKRNDDDRWGSQFLLTADDQRTTTLWRISKEETHKYGSWLVEPIAKGQLPDISSKETTFMTALQLDLLRAQKVDRFTVGTWHFRNENDEECFVLRIAAVSNDAHDFHPVVSIEIRVVYTRDTSSAFLSSSLNDQLSQNVDVRAQDNNSALLQWAKEVENISADYRRKFRLRRARTRFWGSAQSPNRTREAIVVTLHPQDSYEYTTANTEKSWLLIRSMDNAPTSVERIETSLHEVRRSTLDHIVRVVQSRNFPDHELNDQVLKVWMAWTGLQEVFTNEHKSLASALEARATERDRSDVQAPDTQTLVTTHTTTSAETCNLCQSSFSMDVDGHYAICQSGHPFVRCTLSLLAIQEPRISKFCSECERQYLDLAKLRPLPLNTLIADIFDKFDICPVCGGKYRN